MQGDFTRWTFDPAQGFRSVLLQQGRVLLDAEWNEETQITAYHDEVRSRDLIGRSGGPARGAGFAIVDAAGTPPFGTRWADLRITPGSYYVDGILAEAAVPPPVAGAKPAGWPLADQPYLPRIGSTPGLAEPDGKDDHYAVFLDVWTHHVTADEEPRLRESALGGPDTTTRARTVWQVRIAPIEADQHCSDLHQASALTGVAGTMTAGLQAQPPGADPCRITASGGYQLLENQLYRVQIHDTSGPVPRFLWSRENASVVAGLTGITTPSATPGMDADLLLDRVGRDEELSIKAGDTVEVTSTDWQLHGRPGELAVAGAPDGLRLPVTWVAATPAELGAAPIVRRWEGPARDVGTGPLDLEGGIQVGFPGGGPYRSGDYWLIPARAVRLAYGLDAESGTIDWPVNAVGAGLPQPPLGPVHHLTPLAILVRKPSEKGPVWTIESDCRLLFPQLTEQVTIDLLGGDGQEARPGEPLPQPVRIAVRNGGLPVPGARVRFTADFGGHLAVGSVPTTGFPATWDAVTDPAGVIEVRWMLAQTDPSTQTLTVQRLDDHGAALDPAVVVTGRLSIAREVAYTPVCPGFAGVTTVKEALDQLTTTRELRLLGGDGQHVTRRGAVVPQPVRVVLDSPCGPVAGVTIVARAGGDGGLVMPAKADGSAPATLPEGAGAEASGSDGVAAFWWQPGFGDDTSAVLGIAVAGAGDAPIRVTAQLVPAAGGGTGGVHVTALQLGSGGQGGGKEFFNDSFVSPAELVSGITVLLDGPVIRDSVVGKPVMRVVLDLPVTLAAGGEAVGSRGVEIAATLNAAGKVLTWEPADRALLVAFLAERLPTEESQLRGRFEIDGWAIVSEADPTQHLNGHANTVIRNGQTLLILPTDDQVTGGQLTQWFRVRRVPQRATFTLPDIVGRTRAVAERLLVEAGLTVSVTEAADERVRKGLVITTDPTPGTDILPGATVTVLVSSGRAP